MTKEKRTSDTKKNKKGTLSEKEYWDYADETEDNLKKEKNESKE